MSQQQVHVNLHEAIDLLAEPKLAFRIMQTTTTIRFIDNGIAKYIQMAQDDEEENSIPTLFKDFS